MAQEIREPVGQFALRTVTQHLLLGITDHLLDGGHRRLRIKHQLRHGRSSSFLDIVRTGGCDAGAVTVDLLMFPLQHEGVRSVLRQGEGRGQHDRRDDGQSFTHNTDYFCFNHFQRSFQDDFLPNIRIPTL